MMWHCDWDIILICFIKVEYWADSFGPRCSKVFLIIFEARKQMMCCYVDLLC